MSVPQIFRRIVDALERAGISYMLTGSFASSYHGTPRATQDIDLVIAPTPDQLRRLAPLLPSDDFYFDLDTALDAERRQTQFNVVDLTTGWKIDLILRKSRPFSREEFDRRSQVDLEGLRLFIASAEDIVLSKLEWGKLSESQRHLEDVAGILRVRSGDLDRDYIERWVGILGLEPEWESARRLAGDAV